mgnify:CR=1 FL=1
MITVKWAQDEKGLWTRAITVDEKGGTEEHDSIMDAFFYAMSNDSDVMIERGPAQRLIEEITHPFGHCTN